MSSLAAVLIAASTLPRLVSAHVGPSPWNATSGGIAAFDVQLDETGAVTSVETVQDLQPYGPQLAEALRSWRFEPAKEDGRPVASHVLVLGFFRPPQTDFAAPESPRYKSTSAPDDIPWPTSVMVPPYPPNALGSGIVALEADISEDGAVTGTRVLASAAPFDSAATQSVAQWTFRPARRGNRDVPSRAFFVVSFVGTTP
jgi:TonB family protein